MVDKLKVVVAAIEKLSPKEQEHYAAILEEELTDSQRWHELFSHPRSQAFFNELRDELDKEEKDGTIEDSPQDNWA
jgi:hypothetical protein